MPRRPALSKLLQSMEKDELIEEMLKLADKFAVVRDYFTVELSGDTAPLLQKAKLAITRQFQTPAGQFRPEPKASNLNKIIRDFERLSIFKSDLAGLLVHRIDETLRWAAKSDHRAGAALVNSTELAMDKTRKLLAEEGMEAQYADQTAAWNNPNWGHGELREAYSLGGIRVFRRHY